MRRFQRTLTRTGRTAAAPFAVLALACAASVAAAGSSEPPPRAGSGPRSVTDTIGHTIRLPDRPERIVSLAPSVTEMLYAIGAAGRVVGITDFCPLPAGVPAPSRVGGILDPDLERIVSLRPDLVVAATAGNYVEDRDRLERLGVPVFTCDTPDVASILGALEALGRAVGHEEAARTLAGGLRSRLEATERRIASKPRPRVLFVVWGSPLLAPGGSGFLADALRRAGADSVSASRSGRWVEIDLERVIAERPEIILTVPDNREFAGSLAGRPEWATVPAVRGGRVHVVSNDIQQPGPKIVDGIEEVARLLYPEEPGPPAR